jgi:hypothetical protein
VVKDLLASKSAPPRLLDDIEVSIEALDSFYLIALRSLRFYSLLVLVSVLRSSAWFVWCDVSASYWTVLIRRKLLSWTD